MGDIQLIDKQTSIMERGTMSPQSVLAHIAKMQAIMGSILHEGEHYGTIPGTDKPTLLKAGAEKLSFTFRLLPRFRSIIRELPEGHREYEMVCELWHESGVFAGEGVGCCSTMESKYRYRNIADYEDTGDPIPADSKEKKQEYRKQGFGMKKVNGQWLWVKYADTERQENPNIADTWNTVLKMAKKRALVDATITACAASDIFTQDMEEGHEEELKNVTPTKEEEIVEGSSPIAVARRESRAAFRAAKDSGLFEAADLEKMKQEGNRQWDNLPSLLRLTSQWKEELARAEAIRDEELLKMNAGEIDNSKIPFGDKT